MGGEWRNVPVFWGPSPPSNTSKLSAFTNTQKLVPDTETDTSVWFNSVVVYQSDDHNLVMVYTDPAHNFAPDPHVNPNLLARLPRSSTSEFLNGSLPIGVGFAVSFDGPATPAELADVDSGNVTSYLRLSVGNDHQLMPGITEIEDYFWFSISSNDPLSSNLSLSDFQYLTEFDSRIGRYPFPR